MLQHPSTTLVSRVTAKRLPARVTSLMAEPCQMFFEVVRVSGDLGTYERSTLVAVVRPRTARGRPHLHSSSGALVSGGGRRPRQTALVQRVKDAQAPFLSRPLHVGPSRTYPRLLMQTAAPGSTPPGIQTGAVAMDKIFSRDPKR
jgi:hypothetical protein